MELLSNFCYNSLMPSMIESGLTPEKVRFEADQYLRGEEARQKELEQLARLEAKSNGPGFFGRLLHPGEAVATDTEYVQKAFRTFQYLNTLIKVREVNRGIQASFGQIAAKDGGFWSSNSMYPGDIPISNGEALFVLDAPSKVDIIHPNLIRLQNEWDDKYLEERMGLSSKPYIKAAASYKRSDLARNLRHSIGYHFNPHEWDLKIRNGTIR